jgi:hypothetical protein
MEKNNKDKERHELYRDQARPLKNFGAFIF